MNKLASFSIVLLVYFLGGSGLAQEVEEMDTTAVKQASTISAIGETAGKFSETYGMGFSLYNESTYQLSSANQPLLIIDGIPFQNKKETLDFTVADKYDIARWAMVPIESIENIQYLPYSSTYSYLGPAAQNGVLAISTKRNKENAIRVDYGFRNTVVQPTKGYELLNGDDYTMMMKQAFYNPFSEWNHTHRELLYDRSYEDYYNYNKNTDWQDEILQTGNTMQHYLALRGTKNSLGYGVVTDFSTNSGTTIQTGGNDYSLRGYLEYSPSSIFQAHGGINYNQTHSESYFDERNLSFYEVAVRKMPNMSVYRYDADGNQTAEYFEPENNFQGDAYYNPVAYAESSHATTKYTLINPTLHLQLVPVKSLKFRVDASYLEDHHTEDAFDPNLRNPWPNPELGTTYDRKTNRRHLMIFNSVTYSPKLGDKSDLDITGSYTYYKTNYELRDSSNNLASPSFNTQTFNLQQKRNSFGVSAHYNLLDKYKMEASFNPENYSGEDFFTNYSQPCLGLH